MNSNNNNKSPNCPISPYAKYKIVVEAADASFSREFTTIKAMTQYTRRNPNINGIRYVWHNEQWERYAIYGSQVIPKSILETLLSKIS